MTIILCIIPDRSDKQKISALLSGTGDTECRFVETLDEGIGWSRKSHVDLICIPLKLAESDNHTFLKIIRWFQERRGTDTAPSFFWYTVSGDSLRVVDASAGIFALNLTHQVSQEFLSVIRQATGRKRMERSLRAEYDHHTRVIRSLPIAALQISSGQISWTNPAMGALTGHPHASLVGMKVTDILRIPEGSGSGRSSYNSDLRVISGSYRRASGEEMYCRMYWYPEGPSPEGLWYIEDRQDYLMLEETLRITRQECREQLYLSETIIIRINPSGIISFANQAAFHCFGYDTTGLVDQHVSVLFPEPGPDTPDPLEAFLEIENESSSATIHVMEQLRADGRKVFIAWTVRAFYSSSGDLTGILCVGTDMTEETPGGEGRISTRVWRDRILEGTDIEPEVFDSILQACMEIGREGREGKPVGTSFIVGDLNSVMDRSRQLILNPFYGHPPDLRRVTSPDVREMLKEYALLDGAFIVSGSGMLEAAGRYITVDTSTVSLPKGMGTRHSSTAALTGVTSAVGFVVSESGGRVSIIKDGKIVRMIG